MEFEPPLHLLDSFTLQYSDTFVDADTLYCRSMLEHLVILLLF